MHPLDAPVSRKDHVQVDVKRLPEVHHLRVMWREPPLFAVRVEGASEEDIETALAVNQSAFDIARASQRIDADGTKLFGAQMAKRASDAAMQVLGGAGYMGENVVERLWRDAKLLEIGGGTIEAHQKNMTRDLSRMTKLR